jgi:hypothetical protein
VADLSALTPPALMALVVIVAIVAFLRHEMGSKRDREDSASAEDIDAEQVNGADGPVAQPDRTVDGTGTEGR